VCVCAGVESLFSHVVSALRLKTSRFPQSSGQTLEEEKNKIYPPLARIITQPFGHGDQKGGTRKYFRP
jgi:hypothetical protein